MKLDPVHTASQAYDSATSQLYWSVQELCAYGTEGRCGGALVQPRVGVIWRDQWVRCYLGGMSEHCFGCFSQGSSWVFQNLPVFAATMGAALKVLTDLKKY